ncbi:MAG: 3-dehydroquinate dehydratase [Muribaculaceae bacterium]|nr:3-dehydroquinate dehydratase [Muribaculaceae bacterium]
MQKILIINGPSLNLLGRREQHVYGTTDMESCLSALHAEYEDSVIIEYAQTNHEGGIIDLLQKASADKSTIGIVLNAGAYTHTSLAIADAIASIELPVVEVHISNIWAREQIRHTSLISAVCRGVIAGFGMQSYSLAVRALLYTN